MSVLILEVRDLEESVLCREVVPFSEGEVPLYTTNALHHCFKCVANEGDICQIYKSCIIVTVPNPPSGENHY